MTMVAPTPSWRLIRSLATIACLAFALLYAAPLFAQEASAESGEASDGDQKAAKPPAEAPVEPDAQAPDAREADGEAMEEIIVTTARKRRESIYKTPAAITVMNDSMLENLNISNVDDLGKFVPSLNITRFGVGNTSQAAVFIRGIGVQDHLITTDPGVGVYLDGVYLGRQMGNNLSLINIDRIDVLRGPQGTLYGRNTLGGAVNIITRQPGDEEGLQIQLQAGTLGRVAANFYSNFSLGESMFVSATGGFKRRDGIGEAINLENPERRIGEINEFFGRVAAKWELGDSLQILATVDGMKAENGQSPSTIEILGPPVDSSLPVLRGSDIADRDDTATTVPGLESTSNDAIGASLTVTWDITDSWTAKLLGSYRYTQYTGGLDDDTTAYNLSEFPERGDAEQQSYELQVNGKVWHLDIVGGLYYFYERGKNYSGPFTFAPFNLGGEGDFFRLRQKTHAFAVYTNVGYRIFEPLSVGGGIRYSLDDKVGSALFPTFGGERKTNRATFDAVTWDINATYSFTDHMSVYAVVQRGYQTGGFPPRPFGGPVQFNIYDKITATNFELGFKGILFANMSLLASTFWTEYNDLALPFSLPQETGFVTIVENAGSSRALGFEIEANLELAGFFLNPSVGFIHAEITDVKEGTIGIEKGAAPALTPPWTIGANAGYEFYYPSIGSLRAMVDFSFRDRQYGQSVEDDSELLDARSLVGFNIKYTNPGGDWDLDIYGENIFDEVYEQGRLKNPFHNFVGIVLSNDRREFGVRFTKRFDTI